MYSYISYSISSLFFFFNDTATTEIYTLSLHDALPICPPEPLQRLPLCRLDHARLGQARGRFRKGSHPHRRVRGCGSLCRRQRSEEHTSELQSRQYLVCRLLLEKKKKTYQLCMRIVIRQ